MKYKTLLVENPLECPLCGHSLMKGDIMFKDDYRGETCCGYCRESYEENILAEEGEDGRLLK